MKHHPETEFHKMVRRHNRANAAITFIGVAFLVLVLIVLLGFELWYDFTACTMVLERMAAD